MVKKVYIGLGSNLGDKIANLNRACTMINSSLGTIVKKSAYYLTEPWGFDTDDEFVNGALIIETQLSPSELLSGLKKIESVMGRSTKSGSGYESRIIDLDILDYNGEIITAHDLQIPHSGIDKRNFVLIPLTELDKEWKHPQTGLTAQEMLKALKDDSSVVKIN